MASFNPSQHPVTSFWNISQQQIEDSTCRSKKPTPRTFSPIILIAQTSETITIRPHTYTSVIPITHQPVITQKKAPVAKVNKSRPWSDEEDDQLLILVKKWKENTLEIKEGRLFSPWKTIAKISGKSVKVVSSRGKSIIYFYENNGRWEPSRNTVARGKWSIEENLILRKFIEEEKKKDQGTISFQGIATMLGRPLTTVYQKAKPILFPMKPNQSNAPFNMKHRRLEQTKQRRHNQKL